MKPLDCFQVLLLPVSKSISHS